MVLIVYKSSANIARATSADTLRTAMELAKPLRKTPVLARVCYDFIGIS